MNYQASVVHAEDTATSQGTDTTESVDVPEQPETIDVSVTSEGTSDVTSPPTSTPTPADPNATLPTAPNPTGAPPTSSPTVPTPTPAPATTEPTITEVTVSGEIDPNATGVEAFDPIEIQLEGDNLTKDHFLTSEGLRWTEHTRVELTSGTVEGNMNDSAFWGVDNPQVPLVGYTLQAGTTGRLTRVGTTQSGIELDLLWTLEGTDHAEWMANSGNAYDGTVKGFGFVGSQHIPNSNSNSIAVFYNGANTLDMKYRIVKHNTQEEVPVIVSFITTDIDGAQGVKTDLDNLVRYIPPQSNLEEQDGVVYDATARSHGADYNGMAHLPNGGYLGAGFVSNFRYTYYTPAPARESSVYPYSIGARYELFGSALQANMRVNARQYMTTEYVDTNGQTLRPSETYLIRANEHYTVPVPKMDGYLYETHTQTNHSGNVKVRVVYHPATTLKLHYQDESGNRLAPSKTYLRKTGTNFTHQPHHIDGYTIPENYATTLQEATQHTFIYRKPYRVITHYKDTQGNMLAPSQTYTQHRGDTYQQIPPYLAGYTVPNTYQTTVQSDVEYTFVYYREYEVTLNLYDSEDRRLLESLLVKVPQDHAVTYDLPTISGYAPKGRIQLTANNNDTRSVTYQRQYPVTLHFVDQDGVTLFPSETYQVNANAAMDYLAPRKIGYTRPTVYQTVVDAAKTYTFVYHKQPKVTFRYQDMQGNVLQSERVLLVDKGSVLKQEAPTFDDYAMPEIFKQRIEQDTQHVFVYPKLYTITLHYRDEFGKTLRPTQVFKRAEQANVTLESEWIRGYHKPSAYTIILDRDITHTFVYPVAPQPTYHPPYTLSPIPFSPVAKKDTLSNVIAKASTRYVPFHATLAGSPRWTTTPYYPTWQAPHTPIQVGRNKVTHARLQRGIGPNMIAFTRPVTTRPLPSAQQIQTAEYYALDNGGSGEHDEYVKRLIMKAPSKMTAGERAFYEASLKPAIDFTRNGRHVDLSDYQEKVLLNYKLLGRIEKNYGIPRSVIVKKDTYEYQIEKQAKKLGLDPDYVVAAANGFVMYGTEMEHNAYIDFSMFKPTHKAVQNTDEPWDIVRSQGTTLQEQPPLIQIPMGYSDILENIADRSHIKVDISHLIMPYLVKHSHNKTTHGIVHSGGALPYPLLNDKSTELMKMYDATFSAKEAENLVYNRMRSSDRLLWQSMLLESLAGDMLSSLHTKDYISNMDGLYFAMTDSYKYDSTRVGLYKLLAEPNWDNRREEAVYNLLPGKTLNDRKKLFNALVFSAMNTAAGGVIDKKASDLQRDTTKQFLEQRQKEKTVSLIPTLIATSVAVGTYLLDGYKKIKQKQNSSNLSTGKQKLNTAAPSAKKPSSKQKIRRGGGNMTLER